MPPPAAVLTYASAMANDETAFYGYYFWRVIVATSAGDVSHLSYSMGVTIDDTRGTRSITRGKRRSATRDAPASLKWQ